MNPNTLIFSRATYVGLNGTSVATPAATYAFFSKDYRPPEQDRYVEYDIVKNQNGKFKWIYDNGPGFKKWNPFTILCEDKFAGLIGYSATQQYENLRTLWEHPLPLGLQAPEGVYEIHWSSQPIGPNFRIFPSEQSATQEFEVVVQFEEAS